jgi:hypothetical protein
LFVHPVKRLSELPSARAEVNRLSRL